MRILFVIAVLVGAATDVSAAPEPPVGYQVDGNTLYEWCTAPQMSLTGCAAYIDGVSDAISMMQQLAHNYVYCRPKGSTGQQIADVVALYLKQNPAKRHLAAVTLAGDALSDAFPCP